MELSIANRYSQQISHSEAEVSEFHVMSMYFVWFTVVFLEVDQDSLAPSSLTLTILDMIRCNDG